MNTVSLQSMIMQQNPIAPVVGMPCCEIMYTDRYPFTVTRIISDHKIEVKPNKYKVIDFYGEDYEIGEVEHEDPGQIFTLRKNGRWVRHGDSQNGRAIALNTHSMRIDPSF
ncbi:MAG: hypothetical protein Q8R90_07385 [Bacteroidales bacterium]|nr:hypothetical protein [Bacteroidales bacterium]